MTLLATPLTADHRARGAKMAAFAGYDMPIQFAGILAEHAAVRRECGVFDVSHMGHCRTANPAVSRVLSRPLSRMPVGKGTYGLILNDRGGIIDDCISYRLSETEWHIILNASRKEVDVATLNGAGGGPVTPLPDLAMIALQGPKALALAGELCPRRGFARDGQVLGVPVTLACRTGYTGEDGFEFVLPSAHALELWTKLIAAGAAPCGLGARDLLRIEAGLPLYGMDIGEETDPWESGLAFAVDLEDRPELAAREVLAARRDQGTHRRAGLRAPKGAVPRHGYPVLDAAGRVIGEVTSGTFSPLLDAGIALARVEKNATPTAVRIRSSDCAVTEVPLPFYRRSKTSHGS